MRFKKSIRFLIGIVVIIWAVHIVNHFMGYSLAQYGIYPRYIPALKGILFAPFIHANMLHITNNTAIFLILGAMVSLSGYKRLWSLSIFVILLGGLLVWCLGRENYHIGLSGVIFGYWGFVVFNGFAEKSLKAILISIVAIVFYGGLFFGILPTDARISFESHLFGAFAGLLYSYFNRRRKS